MPHDARDAERRAEEYIAHRLAEAGAGERGEVRRAPLALRDLLQRPELLQPPPAVIPNLAYAGRVTLLSAREKTGKSTLLGQAAAAASWGAGFLGEAAQRSGVLWYAIDEPLGDAVRRFELYGAHPDELFIQDTRPTAAQMRAEIEATGATWVVIDTLTELWSGAIESDRSAEDVARFLRPFVSVTRETGAALTLSHHTRKDGTEYRGSVQLGATVDLVLTLRRPGQFRASDDEGDEDDDAGEDDGRRTLRGKGRGIDVNLRLSYDGTHYTLGEAHIPLRLRILRQLMEGDQSGAELATRLHVRKTVMLDELAGLRDEGLVMNAGKRQRITPHGEIEVRFPDSPIGSAIGSRPPHENTPGTDAGTDSSEAPPTPGTELTHAEPERNRWEPIAGTDTILSVPDPNTRDVKSGTDSTPGEIDQLAPEDVVKGIARENAERERRRAEILARAAERARKTAA